MKLFISGQKILASHQDAQDLDNKYSDLELVIVPDQLVINRQSPLDLPDDPRLTMTPEELAAVQTLTEDYHNKKISVIDNFPNWEEIDTKLKEVEDAIPAMASLADARILLTKIMNIIRKDVRVTYWVAKGTQR